ncbi:MAG TPA: hypothetical protein VFL91_02065 [Thermomicrobiales bacterium]|nr:hypothetical protein [Thermomicrobiales bacterium]
MGSFSSVILGMTAYASFLRRRRPERYTYAWRQWGDEPKRQVLLAIGFLVGGVIAVLIQLAFPQTFVAAPIEIPLSGLVGFIIWVVGMGWLLYRVMRAGGDSETDDREDRDNH